MEGVTTLEALGLRDLSAGLCCTTHQTTVLGQAPRRLAGFISSAQQGVPTGAGSSVKWYETQENTLKRNAAQICERELCAEDRGVPLPRGIKQKPLWELSSQSWVRLGQALVPVRPRNAPLLGDQGQHCLQAPPWGLGGEVATNISDTYFFGRRGQKSPLP